MMLLFEDVVSCCTSLIFNFRGNFIKNGMEATKFYKSKEMKKNTAKKSSVDAPKLTSDPAPKGRGRGRGRGKGKADPKKPGGVKNPQTRSSPDREIVLDTLEEDVIDAESLSGEEGDADQQLERDIDDQPNRHNPEDDDEEDFLWKCQLLQYVEEYPILYDKVNPDFKNKYARLAAWEEIATSMDTDGLFPLCT